VWPWPFQILTLGIPDQTLVMSNVICVAIHVPIVNERQGGAHLVNKYVRHQRHAHQPLGQLGHLAGLVVDHRGHPSPYLGHVGTVRNHTWGKISLVGQRQFLLGVCRAGARLKVAAEPGHARGNSAPTTRSLNALRHGLHAARRFPPPSRPLITSW
jgi:hypothetical protein